MSRRIQCDIHGSAPMACAACKAEPELRAFVQAVVAEVARARKKFPIGKNPQALAFAEESGKLVKATLDRIQKRGKAEDIHKEAVQAAAMAARLWLDGDSTIGLRPFGA